MVIVVVVVAKTLAYLGKTVPSFAVAAQKDLIAQRFVVADMFAVEIGCPAAAIRIGGKD